MLLTPKNGDSELRTVLSSLTSTSKLVSSHPYEKDDRESDGAQQIPARMLRELGIFNLGKKKLKGPYQQLSTI